MIESINCIPEATRFLCQKLREKLDSLFVPKDNVSVEIIEINSMEFKERTSLSIVVLVKNLDIKKTLREVSVGIVLWKKGKQVYDFRFSVSPSIAPGEESESKLNFSIPKGNLEDMEIIPLVNRAFFCKQEVSMQQ